MEGKFFDVKTRKQVTVPVVGKVSYGEEGKKRYALRGTTADGRNLTKFVSKAEWDKAGVPVL